MKHPTICKLFPCARCQLKSYQFVGCQYGCESILLVKILSWHQSIRIPAKLTKIQSDNERLIKTTRDIRFQILSPLELGNVQMLRKSKRSFNKRSMEEAKRIKKNADRKSLKYWAVETKMNVTIVYMITMAKVIAITHHPKKTSQQITF